MPSNRNAISTLRNKEMQIFFCETNQFSMSPVQSIILVDSKHETLKEKMQCHYLQKQGISACIKQSLMFSSYPKEAKQLLNDC